MEAAARSTRNALKRHAESLRDDQSRLACRSLLTAIVGAGKRSENPSELIGVVEQVLHVIEAGRRDEAHLPVTLRAVVAFSLEDPRRSRDATEMLRLTLRYSYSLAADHIPRQARDDGGFRATALGEQLMEVGGLYLDEQSFAKLTH